MSRFSCPRSRGSAPLGHGRCVDVECSDEAWGKFRRSASRMIIVFKHRLWLSRQVEPDYCDLWGDRKSVEIL